MRVEVALDDIIVRTVNVIILHTCSCWDGAHSWRWDWMM